MSILYIPLQLYPGTAFETTELSTLALVGKQVLGFILGTEWTEK